VTLIKADYATTFLNLSCRRLLVRLRPHMMIDLQWTDGAFFGIIGTIGVRTCMQRPTPKAQCDIFWARARANNSLVDALRNNFQWNVARYKSALCVCARVCVVWVRESSARILQSTEWWRISLFARARSKLQLVMDICLRPSRAHLCVSPTIDICLRSK
jgi:hypothetical protein